MRLNKIHTYGDRWNFIGKVISLLFNMLSRLVITFLPRSKRLLYMFLKEFETGKKIYGRDRRIRKDGDKEDFPAGASGKEPACRCRKHNEMWI